MTYSRGGDESPIIWRLLLSALKGLPIGAAAVLVLALIAAGIMLTLDDPMSSMGIFGFAILYVGAFVSALVPAAFEREYSIAAALMGGVFYLLLDFIVSLFLRNGGADLSLPCVLIGCGGCIVLSLVAGLIMRPRAMRVRTGSKSPAAMARGRLGKRR